MSVLNHEAPRSSVLEKIGNGFSAFLRWYEAHSDLGRCAAYASKLNKLSDEELAKLGIKRNQIVNHAFSRYIA